jgi:transcriptional regulator with XRE-family HTH domain
MCDFPYEFEEKIEMQSRQVVLRLKEEREKARISQMDLSFKAGLSQNLINYIENGKRNPSLHTLLRICDALQIDPARLFFATDEERKLAQETIIGLVRKWM